MMTDPQNVRHGLRRNADRLGMPMARSTVAGISERDMRLKRLILVGALASFLSLFGLTIAVDHQTQQAQQTVQTTGGATGSFSSLNNNGAPLVAQPQIRTRSS